jgi:hypothetical protein
VLVALGPKRTHDQGEPAHLSACFLEAMSAARHSSASETGPPDPSARSALLGLASERAFSDPSVLDVFEHTCLSVAGVFRNLDAGDEPLEG